MSEPEVPAILTEPEPSIHDWLSLRTKITTEDEIYEKDKKEFLKKSRFIEKDLVRTLSWLLKSATSTRQVPDEVDYTKIGELLYRLHVFRFQKVSFSSYQIYKTAAFGVSNIATLSGNIQTEVGLLNETPKEPNQRYPTKKFLKPSEKFRETTVPQALYFLPVTAEQGKSNKTLVAELCIMLPGATCLAIQTLSREELENSLKAFHSAFTNQASDSRNILFGALIVCSNQVLGQKNLGKLIEPSRLTQQLESPSESAIKKLLDDAQTRPLTTAELTVITDFCVKHKQFDGVSNLFLIDTIPEQLAQNLVAPDTHHLTLLEVAVNHLTRHSSIGTFTTKRQLLQAVTAPLDPETKIRLLSSHYPKPEGLQAIFSKYMRASPSFPQTKAQQLSAKHQFLTDNNLEALRANLLKPAQTVQAEPLSQEYIDLVVADIGRAFSLLKVEDIDENRRAHRQFDVPGKGYVNRNAKIKVKYPKVVWKDHVRALRLLRSVFSSHSAAPNFLDLATQLKRFGPRCVERWLLSWMRSQLLSKLELEQVFKRLSKLKTKHSSEAEFTSQELFKQVNQYLHLAMDKLASFHQLNDFSPLSPMTDSVLQYLLVTEHEETATPLYEKLIRLSDQLKGGNQEQEADAEEEHPLSEIRRVEKLFSENSIRFEKYLQPGQPSGATLKHKVLFEFGLFLLKKLRKSVLLQLLLGSDRSGRRFIQTAKLESLLEPEKESPKPSERRRELLVRCLVAKCEGRTWGQLTESLSASYSDEPRELVPRRIRAVVGGMLGDNKRRPCRPDISDGDTDYTLNELLIYHLRRTYTNLRPEALTEETPRYIGLWKHALKSTNIKQASVKSVLPPDLDLESAQIGVLATKLTVDQFQLLLEKIGSQLKFLEAVVEGLLVASSVQKLEIFAKHLETQFGHESPKIFGKLLAKLTVSPAPKTTVTAADGLKNHWTTLYHTCREVRLSHTGYVIKTKGKCVPRLKADIPTPEEFLAWYRQQAVNEVRVPTSAVVQQMAAQLGEHSWKLIWGLSTTDNSFSTTTEFKFFAADSRVEPPEGTTEFFGVDKIKKHTDSSKVKQIDLVVTLLRKTSRYAYDVLLKELYTHGLLIKYLPILSQLCPVKSAWDSIFADQTIATEVLEGFLTRLRGVTPEATGLFQLNRFEKPVFREDVIGGPVDPPAELSSSIVVPGYTYIALLAIQVHPNLDAADRFLEFAWSDAARSASYFLGAKRMIMTEPETQPKIRDLHDQMFRVVIGPCKYQHHCWLLPELDINKIIKAEFGDTHVTLSDPEVSKKVLTYLSTDESLSKGYVHFVKTADSKKSVRRRREKEEAPKIDEDDVRIKLSLLDGKVSLAKVWYRQAAKETLDRELDFNNYMGLINYTLELTKDAQFKFSSYLSLKPFEKEEKKRKLINFKIEAICEEALTWDPTFDAVFSLKFTHITYPTIASMTFRPDTPVPQADKKLHSSYYVAQTLVGSMKMLACRASGYLNPEVLSKFLSVPQEAFYPKNMLTVPKKLGKLFRFRFDIDEAVDFYNQMDFQEALLLSRLVQALELAEDAFIRGGDDSDPLVKNSHLLGGQNIQEIMANCYLAVEKKKQVAEPTN